jgi:hypothetical protein
MIKEICLQIFQRIWVKCPLPSEISIGAGPVLSYYEFKQPMHDRLNDESWKKMLNSNNCPREPEWISEYST